MVEVNKGIIREDIVYTILEGYSINGIHVHKDSEQFAAENVGKEVSYELNYDGYRKYGMWKESFYEKALIVVPHKKENNIPNIDIDKINRDKAINFFDYDNDDEY